MRTGLGAAAALSQGIFLKRAASLAGNTGGTRKGQNNCFLQRCGSTSNVSKSTKRRTLMLRTEFKLGPSHMVERRKKEAEAREIETSADNGFASPARLI